jgi:hypothetical protein
VPEQPLLLAIARANICIFVVTGSTYHSCAKSRKLCSVEDSDVAAIIDCLPRLLYQDNLEEMTSDASNMLFLVMWPVFNVLLVSNLQLPLPCPPFRAAASCPLCSRAGSLSSLLFVISIFPSPSDGPAMALAQVSKLIRTTLHHSHLAGEPACRLHVRQVCPCALCAIIVRPRGSLGAPLLLRTACSFEAKPQRHAAPAHFTRRLPLLAGVLA